jgi:hypothetical protein
MSTSKELQSLAARKEKECLPELVLTLGSTRLLLVDPRVFWQCTFLKGVNKYRKLHGSRSINEKSHACLAKYL